MDETQVQMYEVIFAEVKEPTTIKGRPKKKTLGSAQSIFATSEHVAVAKAVLSVGVEVIAEAVEADELEVLVRSFPS